MLNKDAFENMLPSYCLDKEDVEFIMRTLLEKYGFTTDQLNACVLKAREDMLRKIW